jgi:hypothetical protein
MSGPKGVQLKVILDTVFRCKNEINDHMKEIIKFRDEIFINNFKNIEFTSSYLEKFESFYEDAEQLFAKAKTIDNIDINRRDIEAEKILRKMQKVSFEIINAKEKIIGKILSFRDLIMRKFKALENTKKHIESIHISCNFKVSDDKIYEAKEKLKDLSNIIVPKCPYVDYNNFHYDELIKYLSDLEFVENEIIARFNTANDYVKSLNAEAAQELISDIKIEKYLTIDDLLNEKKKNMIMDGSEFKFVEKASQILSKFSELNLGYKYNELINKYDAIKNEESFDRRIMLYNDYIFYCDRLLNEEKRLKSLSKEILFFKAKLKKLNNNSKAIELIKKLEKYDLDKNYSEFENFKPELILFIDKETIMADNQYISNTIKKTFEELGYETEQDFETLLVKNQKLYINKPDLKNYSVQIVSNAENSMLQIEVVRTVENENQLNESSRSSEIRDTEVETEFCKDYKEVLKKLEENGIQVEQKMHKKPGEVQIKKVLAMDIKQKIQRTTKKVHEQEKNVNRKTD